MACVFTKPNGLDSNGELGASSPSSKDTLRALDVGLAMAIGVLNLIELWDSLRAKIIYAIWEAGNMIVFKGVQVNPTCRAKEILNRSMQLK